MNRWIQNGALTALLCGFLLATAVPGSPQQTPAAQDSQQPNTQQTSPAAPAQTSEPGPTPSQQPATQAVPPPATSKEPEQKSEKAVPAGTTAKEKRARAKCTSPAQPGKVVVRNGGAKDSSAQISPGMTREQALHNRENTAQLLATTDANLKSVAGHKLSPAQQSMRDQIHAYVRQSKAASASGDLSRAHTLAYKAHLLSDNLAGR